MIACAPFCVCRFISDVIKDLAAEANGISTVKQLGKVKCDEIEWPPLAPARRKGSVRLAMRVCKATHGAPTAGCACWFVLLGALCQVMQRKEDEPLWKGCLKLVLKRVCLFVLDVGC